MSRAPRIIGAATAESDDLLLVDLIRPLARRWRLLVIAPTVAVLLALGLALVWPRTYTARASFTPEQSSSSSIANALSGLGGLGSLVGQIGGLPSSLGGSSVSPDFFAGVLKSRELLLATLSSTFADPEQPAVRRTLLELLRPRGSTPERRQGNALRKLDDKAVVTVDRRTGIVTLAVTLRDPRLASDVANRMTQLLNVYNLERRQFSSREQRRFVEGRLAQAEQELRAAERAQSAFLVSNRAFDGSPRLDEEATRLSRDVRLRQEIVLGLRKLFEDARIAEVRDTPVLSVIDHAAPPDRATNPRPLLWAALAGLLGLIGAASVAFALGARGNQDAEATARGADFGATRDVVALRDATDALQADSRTTVQRP